MILRLDGRGNVSNPPEVSTASSLSSGRPITGRQNARSAVRNDFDTNIIKRRHIYFQDLWHADRMASARTGVGLLSSKKTGEELSYDGQTCTFNVFERLRFNSNELESRHNLGTL